MDTLNYVALSHQMALERQMALIANNIANMNTAGYKREEAVFETHLNTMPSAPVNSARPISFVLDQGIARDFGQGNFIPTDDPLNVAIIGDGYFTVRTPDGTTAYTRNGNFRLSPEGFLTTDAGAQVLGVGGQPIQFQPGETDFYIAADGSISTSMGPRGRLEITTFADGQLLDKQGDSLMVGEGGQPLPANQVRLKPGVIEGSNVKPVMEMAEMISVLRSYQSTSRLIERYTDIRQQGIERLARVQ